ncbi:MAG: type VI secretion system protein TssA [Pseudomonadota bacterium]
MKKARDIDLSAILAPVPGDNPGGQNLRYASVYEEIKEARRADDPLERGDWQHEIKRSDWDKVIRISVEALTAKSKDLQIAAWLAEALVKTEGFSGLLTGLKMVNGLLGEYWDHLYPEMEDGDLDYRAAPIEFINDRMWLCVKETPLTDTDSTPGYSWLKWQESRDVGYESSCANKYGDVDEEKRKRREELIAEGRLAAEDFDSAVGRSSRNFYIDLAETLGPCREEFKRLDELVDQKFGSNAPRLSDFGKSIEDCEQVVSRIVKEKQQLEPEAEFQTAPAVETAPGVEAPVAQTDEIAVVRAPEGVVSPAVPGVWVNLTDSVALEEDLWKEAVRLMQTSGIRAALDRLVEISCRAPSIREKSRCRLIMVRLCLKANRPDLARPVIEELNALIEELHLERWESPRWIAEVLDALYQCLTMGEPVDDDLMRARTIFQKICTIDVTRAIGYK